MTSVAVPLPVTGVEAGTVAGGRRIERILGFAVPGSIGVMTLFHVAVRGNDLRVVNGLVAAALFAVFALAARSYLLNPIRWSPVMPVALLQLYVFHGLGIAWNTRFPTVGGLYRPSPEVMLRAQLIALGASVLFLGGYFLALARTNHARTIPVPKPEAEIGVFTGYSVVWSVLALAYNGSLLVSGVDLGVFANFGATFLHPILVGAILLAVDQRAGSRSFTLYTRGYLVAVAAMGALSGMLESLVRPLLLYFVASWLYSRKVNWRILGIAVLAATVYSPAKYVFRDRAWHADMTLASLSQHLLDSVSETWKDDGAEIDREMVASRFSEAVGTAQVVDWVPFLVPHRSWESLRPLAIFAIPRFVWPEKPDLTRITSGEYALSFGRTMTGGSANYAITAVAEGYWAFGLIGSLAFLFVLGIEVGVFARVCQKPGVVGETIWMITPILTVRLHSSGVWMSIHSLREVLAQVIVISLLLAISRRRL